MIFESRWPVIIADTAGRSEAAFNALIELAEALSAPVLDRGGRLNFPSLHPLNLTGQERETLSRADLVLAFDLADFSGAVAGLSAQARVIHVHLNDVLIKGGER